MDGPVGSHSHVRSLPSPPLAVQAFTEKLQASTLVRDQEMITELTRVLQQYWLNRRNVTQQFALEAARLLKCEPNLVRQLRDVIEQSEDIELTLAGEPQRPEGSEAELVVYTSGDTGEILNLTSTPSEFSISTNTELRKAILSPGRDSERILKPPSSSWASCIMELLQLEMKLADGLNKQGLVDTNYGKLCLHYLRYLAREYNALPPSFILHDITVEEKHPLWGGGFSDIYKGILNEKPVCVKVLRVFLSTYDREKLFREFSREALVWKQLRHPNVLPFLGVSWTLFRPSFALISPWCENGSIQGYIERHPEFDRWKAISQVADAMRYLHEYTPGIVHCDIRASNILIADNGNCLLADFGLVSVGETQGISTKTSDVHGSTRWMAPELLDPATSRQCHKAPTTPRDIYAYGCTVLEIFSGRIPFVDLPQDATVVCEVLAGRRPPIHEDVPTDLAKLVKDCWIHDPTERPSARQIATRLAEMSATDDEEDEVSSFDPNLLVRPSAPPPVLIPRISVLSASSSSTQRPLPLPKDLTTATSIMPPITRALTVDIAQPVPLKIAEGPPPKQLHVVNPTLPVVAKTPPPPLAQPQPLPPSLAKPQPKPPLTPTPKTPPPERIDSPPSSVAISKPYHMPSPSDFPESPPPDYLSTIASFSPPPLLVPSPWNIELTNPYGSFLSQLPSLPRPFTPLSAFVPRPPDAYDDNEYPPEKAPPTPEPPDSRQRRPTVVIPLTNFKEGPLSPHFLPIPPNASSSSSQQADTIAPVRRTDDILSKTVLLRKLEAQTRKNYDPVLIEECLAVLIATANEDPANAARLVAAGALPVLCQLLWLQFSMGKERRLTLLLLGCLLINESCSQIVVEQKVMDILISPLSSVSLDILPLSLWTLARACRTPQVANKLMTQGVTQLLNDNCFAEDDDEVASRAAILVGALAVTPAEAERLGKTSVIQTLWDYIRKSYPSPTYLQNIRSATYAFARLSQSPKSALLITRVGFLRSLTNYLLASEDFEILEWSARLVGLMLRHNSSEIITRLVEAEVPTALIRIPTLITTTNLPYAINLISSYAFALRSLTKKVVQREDIKSTYNEEGIPNGLAILLSMVSRTPPQVDAQLELLKTLCHVWDSWGSWARKRLRESCIETMLHSVWSHATPGDEVWKQCQVLEKKLSGKFSGSPWSPTSPLRAGSFFEAPETVPVYYSSIPAFAHPVFLEQRLTPPREVPSEVGSLQGDATSEGALTDEDEYNSIYD